MALVAILFPSNVVLRYPTIVMVGYVFVAIVAFLVAYISAEAYRNSGSLVILFIGSGALMWGSSSLLAAVAVGFLGAGNIPATLYLTGLPLAGLLNFQGAFLATVGPGSTRTQRRGGIQILVYSCTLIVMVLIAAATFLGATPSFFVPGVGNTVLNSWSAGLSMGLFGISSFIFLRIYFKSRSELLYWYSLSLAAIALGAFSLLLMRAPDSLVHWIGRFANYIGAVYLLLSVRTTS